MKNEVFSTVAELTGFYVNNAVQTVIDELPDDESRDIFQQELQQIGQNGIHAVMNGQGFEKELQQGAVAAAKYAATHYTSEAFDKVAKRMPKGIARDLVEEDLRRLSMNGISSICSGADFDNVLADVETHFSLKTKNFLKSEAEKIGNSWIDSIAGEFKDKGRGKGRTRKNRRINSLSGKVKSHLYANISSNLDGLWQGNKNLPTALTDIAMDTAGEAVLDFAKEQAKQIGNDILKTATKKASKELVSRIENKAIKGIAKKGLKKISNVDGLVDLAQDVKAIGSYVGKFLDGEIDRADLMQEVTDRTANAVSNAVEKIATVFASELGPAAPVIGYVAGYVAGNLIRQAVAPFINAARKAKWAKERYDTIHEMSEQAIKQLQEQRRLFEKETQKLFSDRKTLIEESFKNLDDAINSNDVNAAAKALNNISMEFGGKNKLSTFEEFDDFVMNGKNELVW